jgi:hypothetical protein
MPDLPIDFDKVVVTGAEFQKHLPWLDLVGGTASALHAQHRVSHDVDFLTKNLKPRFEEILSHITEWSEWKTNRIQSPVIILGEAHNVRLGVRQQIREKPFDTVQLNGLRIPTLEECFKIKVFLVGKRRATRDYVDACALLDKLPEDTAYRLLSEMDGDFPSVDNLSNTARFATAVRQIPADFLKAPLSQFEGLKHPYTDWDYIEHKLIRLSILFLEKRLTEEKTRDIQP